MSNPDRVAYSRSPLSDPDPWRPYFHTVVHRDGYECITCSALVPYQPDSLQRHIDWHAGVTR